MNEAILQTPETSTKILMYGTSWCGDCRFAKRWLDSHNIAYDYIDIEQDEAAADIVVKLNKGARSVPTILFPDGSVLVEPNASQLAAKLL